MNFIKLLVVFLIAPGALAQANSLSVSCNGTYIKGERILISSDPSLLVEGGDIFMQYGFNPNAELNVYNGMHLEYKIISRKTAGSSVELQLEMTNYTVPSHAKRILTVDGTNSTFQNVDDRGALLVTTSLACE